MKERERRSQEKKRERIMWSTKGKQVKKNKEKRSKRKQEK